MAKSYQSGVDFLDDEPDNAANSQDFEPDNPGINRMNDIDWGYTPDNTSNSSEKTDILYDKD